MARKIWKIHCCKYSQKFNNKIWWGKVLLWYIQVTSQSMVCVSCIVTDNAMELTVETVAAAL